MRSIWKGDLSFGLVNVPVKVYSATQSHDRSSHQVDAKDGTRIRYRRVREGTDIEVDYANIASAYETDDGRPVILTKEDLATLPVSRSPEISIIEFVPAEQVDPIYFDKAYYLEPASRSPKAYTLLAQALASTDRLAIATFTLRTRTSLAALRVLDRVMVLQTLLWPDEVRTPDFGFLDEDVEIRPQELEMASSLIGTMATDFDPDQFEDVYENELAKLIAAKAEGEQAFPEPDEAASGVSDDDEVADLLAALRASVKDRAGDGQNETEASVSTATKKTAAKKTTAKKTTAKKTTAKKAPAKRAPKSA
ncbi:putative DNA repair protein [Gordonia hirsuta DSM 44140 = NBRC 16056]|uniref:Non-homologous end joining protein Ku n=1 Tax=Gordonia hirsuta DSM 44140 = NBRC 16056 TaxID=1121927 RepID=L7LCQ3_9ACTN|nr:Ku protein [Gordonia hirsuta]GAC57823.1 putative DNA repair protein [Gordonia hirsuta DSM 44140 = NBRC 16056]